MRKLILTAVTAIAALAFTATPALAQNPDFPNGDYEADNWRGVNVLSTDGLECEVADTCTVESEDMATWTGTSPYRNGLCLESMNGEVNLDGSIDDVNADVQAYSGTAPCRYFEANPMSAQICWHEGDEFYLRQEVDYTIGVAPFPSVTGTTFATLEGYVDYGGIGASSFRFGSPYDETFLGTVGGNTLTHSSHHVFDTNGVDVLVVMATGEELPYPLPETPCAWPELS